MALLKFRGIYLEDFEQLEVKDPDTRYIVFNPDGTVYGEFIGDQLIGVKASDFESSIEELELETERLDGEVIRVEQKVDGHIEDVSNPHGVTAEQVGTYDKATIDQKDANVLQAAKDYTYSKADIDAKDDSTLQAAKDFTYGKTEIDAKDANTLQEAKDYTDDRISEEVTAEKIKQLYEANPDTNAFTDAEKAKLSGIEEGAEVNTVRPEDLDADNISFDGSGTNFLAGEADVESAIKELDTQVKTNADKLDEIDLGLEHKIDKVETRQVGETIITYESGVIVSMSSDNVVESIEYDVNGEVEKVISTYADGKVYEETYTKDVNGNITKIMKVEVI